MKHLFRATLKFFWKVLVGTELLEVRSLKFGEVDNDEILLHAAFQALVNWVEEEKGLGWWHPEGRGAAAVQLESLYKWWTEERPKRYANDDPNDGGDVAVSECDTSMALENRWKEEDQAKLAVLIGHRSHLWA